MTVLKNANDYYFQEADVSKLGLLSSCNSAFAPRDSENFFWYHRMVHPSLQYLKHVFPSIFMNKKSIEFQCESYELNKVVCHIY